MNPSIWKRLKDNRINKEVLLIHRLKAILGRNLGIMQTQKCFWEYIYYNVPSYILIYKLVIKYVRGGALWKEQTEYLKK